MADPPTKRRSSIRLPISTRNYEETVNETTKSQKRVSFSSRNRIKTFMRDNETTQLDATYEESANHTDSTQSSQELTNKSINKPDLSSCSQIQNVKGSLIDFVKQTQSQQEQISLDGNNDAESISMEIEIIERTTTIHVNNRIVVVDKENLPTQTIVQDDKENLPTQTIVQDDKENLGLPLVVADHNLDRIGQMQQTSNKTVNMDITCMDTEETNIRNHEILTDNLTLKPNQEERNDQSRLEQTVEDNMEFTCRLPNLSCREKNHTLGNKTDMELTCQQVLINESQLHPGNMVEDTKLPLNCDPSALKLNKTDIEISCEKERSNTSQMTQIKEKEMEFTCVSNFASNSIGSHTEMELTCHPNRTEQSIQKDEKLLNCEDEDMEFTCRIPALLRADNVTLKYEVEGKILERINKTATTIQSLEFTCELDKFALENQQKIDEIVPEQKTTETLDLYKTNDLPVEDDKGFERVKIEMQGFDEIVPEQKNTETLDLYKTNNLSVEDDKGFEPIKIEMQGVDEIKLEESIDVEEMEWKTITPQKSLRKSIISNDNQEKPDTSRKRSLISSFIPYDSPQITKKTLRPNNTTPVFRKSATPTKIPTPISCKSKRNLTLSINSNHSGLDKENLQITTPTGNMETKNILYTQKVDNNLLKGICDFSEIQTPDGSGLKVASPCIDNTQQLIGATFTLTQLETDLTKLQTTTTKVDTLKEIEITLPETNTDTSLPESRFFKNINNTFVLNKMTNIHHQHNDTPTIHSGYLDDISVELVTSPVNSKTEDENDDGYDFPLTKQILEEIENGKVEIDTIFDTLEIEPIKTRRRTQEMRDFIDNFEFQTFNLEKFKDELKQIMNDVELKPQEKLQNGSIDNDPDSEDEKVELEERIRILAKGIDERIWKLMNINRNIYKFGMVFNKVGLTVKLNAENELVMDVTVDILTPNQTNNLLMYVHRAIKEKLNSSNVQLSLGKSYDLIGFMQYIEMFVEKFLVFIKEFINLGDYHPTINEDCWLSFKIRKPKKLKYFIISINLLNLDRLTIDDIQVLSIFGNCNVERVEMIAKQCSKLPNFLNSFIKALDE